MVVAAVVAHFQQVQVQVVLAAAVQVHCLATLVLLAQPI
jgi:hypothetical protein